MQDENLVRLALSLVTSAALVAGVGGLARSALKRMSWAAHPGLIGEGTATTLGELVVFAQLFSSRFV
jgi:hypothetical protein